MSNTTTTRSPIGKIEYCPEIDRVCERLGVFRQSLFFGRPYVGQTDERPGHIVRMLLDEGMSLVGQIVLPMRRGSKTKVWLVRPTEGSNWRQVYQVYVSRGCLWIHEDNRG
jgi:hypothetical protein